MYLWGSKSFIGPKQFQRSKCWGRGKDSGVNCFAQQHGVLLLHSHYWTTTIYCRLNPVWTVDTGSLFIVTCPAEEFFSFASGLTFCIKDFDAVTSDEVVGQVSVSQDALLSMNGERVTLDLKIPRKFMNKKNSKKLYGPKLNLRVRKARPEDVTFMKTLHSIKRSKKKGLHASTSSVSPKIQPTGLVKKRKSKVVDGVTLVSQ